MTTRRILALIVCFCSAALLAAAEPLWQYAPSSTSLAFYFNVEALRKTEFFQRVSALKDTRRLMNRVPQLSADDFSELLLIADKDAGKLSWIAGYSDDSVHPKVMRVLKKNLIPIPKTQNTFRIRSNSRLFDELRFVPWDSRVAGVYPRRGVIVRDGASPKLCSLTQRLPNDALCFAVGLPAFKGAPLDSIKEFFLVVRPNGDKLMLQAMADFDTQFSAALFCTTMRAMVAVWLQNAAGLSQEEAAAEIGKYRIEQRGYRLTLCIDDVDVLARSLVKLLAMIDNAAKPDWKKR